MTRKRGRPKKHLLPIEELFTAMHVLRARGRHKDREKAESIVRYVAAAEGVSERTVWSRLRKRRWWAMQKLEEEAYDAMLDAGHKAEWEAARASLAEEYGDRTFSDEEIEDRIELERLRWADFDP